MDFEIEFRYQRIIYFGSVRPYHYGKETWYDITLESDDQEDYIQFTAKPSNGTLDDWEFTCSDHENAEHFYEKELLQCAGQAIEKSKISKAVA